jgi:hypothetical protein
MAAYWILDVTYALNVHDFTLDDKLRAVVGKDPSGSGAGFGERDIDWTFHDGAEADTVAAKLRDYAAEHDLKIAVMVTQHLDED